MAIVAMGSKGVVLGAIVVGSVNAINLRKGVMRGWIDQARRDVLSTWCTAKELKKNTLGHCFPVYYPPTLRWLR